MKISIDFFDIDFLINNWLASSGGGGTGVGLETLDNIIPKEVRDKVALELLEKIGPLALTFLVLLILSQLFLWRLYTGRLADRQAEIDRMASDNKEKQNMINQLVDDLRGKE